jgi:CMP-N-acetylneuraminic acid synthetase
LKLLRDKAFRTDRADELFDVIKELKTLDKIDDSICSQGHSPLLK